MTFNLRGGNPRELCHDLRSEILDERRAPRAPRRSAPISDEMVLGMERDEDETVEGRGGKEWRRNQIRKITDKVFDHFKNENGTANLRFEDVYIGVLLVYNDINKRLPGPHFDPPSKDSIRLLIQEHDINLDGEINREEFAKLIKQMTADTFCVVSQGLIVTLVAAPTVAMATKRATEGVPHVGKVVQRIPTSVYASLVTLIVVLVQHIRKEL
ncbi:hypothetical protein ACLB2K_072626 [Fragaria x ananassa]